jgi:hypothetical protein
MKYITAEELDERINEVHKDLETRWDDVHADDMSPGFFHCFEKTESGWGEGYDYISNLKIRVCDGCGEELYPTGSVCADFHCTECELWYSGIDGGHLKPPSMWGEDTGESFNNKGEIQ